MGDGNDASSYEGNQDRSGGGLWRRVFRELCPMPTLRRHSLGLGEFLANRDVRGRELFTPVSFLLLPLLLIIGQHPREASRWCPVPGQSPSRAYGIPIHPNHWLRTKPGRRSSGQEHVSWPAWNAGWFVVNHTPRRAGPAWGQGRAWEPVLGVRKKESVVIKTETSVETVQELTEMGVQIKTDLD